MPVTYTLTSGPAAEPVILVEVKKHCREDDTGQDQLLAALVQAAREKVEGDTGRQLVSATVRERFDCFPEDGPIRLSLAPVQSVTSVAYVDADGDSQTLDAADYRVDAESEPARIEPAYGEAWPAAQEVVNAVTVTYLAGWATAAAVPQSLKQAILLLVGHWYANRETVVVGTISGPLELAYQSLIDRWAVYTR